MWMRPGSLWTVTAKCNHTQLWRSTWTNCFNLNGSISWSGRTRFLYPCEVHRLECILCVWVKFISFILYYELFIISVHIQNLYVSTSFESFLFARLLMSLNVLLSGEFPPSDSLFEINRSILTITCLLLIDCWLKMLLFNEIHYLCTCLLAINCILKMLLFNELYYFDVVMNVQLHNLSDVNFMNETCSLFELIFVKVNN